MKCPGCQSEFELILFDSLRLPWNPHRCPVCRAPFRFLRPLGVVLAIALVMAVLAVIPAVLIGWLFQSVPLGVGVLALYAGAFVLPLSLWLDNRWGKPVLVSPDAGDAADDSGLASSFLRRDGIFDSAVARFAAVILALPSWVGLVAVMFCIWYGLDWPDFLPPVPVGLICIGMSLVSMTVFLFSMGEHRVKARYVFGLAVAGFPLLAGVCGPAGWVVWRLLNDSTFGLFFGFG